MTQEKSYSYLILEGEKVEYHYFFSYQNGIINITIYDIHPPCDLKISTYRRFRSYKWMAGEKITEKEFKAKQVQLLLEHS